MKYAIPVLDAFTVGLIDELNERKLETKIMTLYGNLSFKCYVMDEDEYVVLKLKYQDIEDITHEIPTLPI
jgi:hypothetical protein